MKEKAFLVIGKNGIRGVRKTRPSLQWDELCCLLEVDVPDTLFVRPQLSATLRVEDVPLKPFDVESIVNTADLIEQQTGAKIHFTVIHTDEDNET